MVGETRLARAYLLVPGQAPRLLRLLPDKLADGGGLSPQTSYEEVLPVFKTGHRYAVLHHPKKGSHGWNRTSGLQLRKLLLFLLSYAGIKQRGTPAGSPDASKMTGAFPPKEIGGDGGNRTHSLNLARIGRRYDCHPQKWRPRQVSHPDLPH